MTYDPDEDLTDNELNEIWDIAEHINMAEDPATWGRAEHIVNDVLEQAETDSEVCGLSVVKQITNALRNAGLLMEEDSPTEQEKEIRLRLDDEDKTRRMIERDIEERLIASDLCSICGAKMVQKQGGLECLSDHK